jgi:hypothetical protein
VLIQLMHLCPHKASSIGSDTQILAIFDQLRYSHPANSRRPPRAICKYYYTKISCIRKIRVNFVTCKWSSRRKKS